MALTYLLSPGRFPALNLQLVNSYAKLHDWPKVQPVEALREYGYTHAADLATRLYSFDGKAKEDLQGSALARLKAAINDTNRIERLRKRKVFYRELLKTMPRAQVNEIRHQLKTLENIVDWTVTGIFRRLELGIRGSQPLHGARYLVAIVRAPFWQIELSVQLERYIQRDSDSLNDCDLILKTSPLNVAAIRKQANSYN